MEEKSLQKEHKLIHTMKNEKLNITIISIVPEENNRVLSIYTTILTVLTHRINC